MLEIGDQAIDFTLPASDGSDVKLSDLQGQTVVLYFYPKDLTPGCTTEACDFRDYSPEFEKLNTVILGVSRDPLKSHQKFVQKHDLPFLLLSDEEEKVCKAYGVMKEKNMFGRKVWGIERTTFVINPSGRIINIYRKVRVKNHVKEVLDFIKNAKGSWTRNENQFNL